MAETMFSIPAGSTLYVPVMSYSSAGASSAMTGLAVTDIEIYKNGSTTQRSSDNGYTLLDTDGLDVDSITGLNGFSIDLADNTDAGFYAVGSQYWVVVSTVTVDSQTVSFLACWFRIVAAESTAGYPNVTVKSGTGTGELNLSSGVIDANLTKIAGASVSTSTAQLGVNVVNNAGSAITSASGIQEVKVASIAANAITATAIASDAITDAKVASDVTIASVTGAVGSVTGAVGSVTGNVGGNVTGSVGSVAAGGIAASSFAAGAIDATAIAADAIGSSELAATACTEIADAILNRDMSAVSDTNARSPLNALRFLRNKWSISGSTLTVTEEDDTTEAWTSSLSSSASADPVTGSDPA